MEIVHESHKITLPCFLMVGVAKAGTTAIYYALKQHPDIRMPDLKEPRFFSYWNKPPCFINPSSQKPVAGIITELDRYSAIFESFKDDGSVIGEASTSYFYTAQDVVDNMKLIYGKRFRDVKIIIVLRNPIDRIWSQYGMQIRDKQETKTLLQAISSDCIKHRINNNWPAGFDYVGYSMYASKIKVLKVNFKHVSILFHEDIESDWKTSIKKLFNFLEVDSGFEYEQKRYNVSGKPKNKILGFIARFIYGASALKSVFKGFVPRKIRYYIRTRLSGALLSRGGISSEEYNQLLKIFRDDILETQKLTGRDLSDWLVDR